MLLLYTTRTTVKSHRDGTATCAPRPPPPLRNSKRFINQQKATTAHTISGVQSRLFYPHASSYIASHARAHLDEGSTFFPSQERLSS